MIAYTYIYVSVSCALASARSNPHPTQRTERYNPRIPTDAHIVSVTLQDDPKKKKPDDSDDEKTAILERARPPARSMGDYKSKRLLFYSLGLAIDSHGNRPDDLHGIINSPEARYNPHVLSLHESNCS